MSFQQMIDYNNATAAFLQQHDLYNAITSSSRAMRLLRELRGSASMDVPPTSPQDALDQCMLLLDFQDKDDHEEDHSTSTPFVYDQGIPIPPPSMVTMPFEVVCAVLIFNAALAHQLYAQEQDRVACQVHLQKSKRLYQLALRVCTSVEHNVLFQFVVMNNIAVIELQIGNKVKSKKCFEELMPAFMLLVDQGCWSRIRQLCGFLRNLSYPCNFASAA